MANETRRNFLRGIFAAGVVGVGVAGLAGAAFGKTPGEKAVLKLIKLHDELLAMCEKVTYGSEAYNYSFKPIVSAEVYDAKFDELLAHINTFDVPTKGSALWNQAVDETHWVFNNRERGAKAFRDIPPTVLLAVAGISAMRSILSVHRMKMDTKNLKSFFEFADKYRELILTDPRDKVSA